MRGRGTLVGAPGEVERRKRNTNAETQRARSWYREVEELPRECRNYGTAEIIGDGVPALRHWANFFRTYAGDAGEISHGRSSMEWGTWSIGRSRGTKSVWAGDWPERMERRLSVEWRARNSCRGSAERRCAWKCARRRVIALGTSSAA